MPEYKLIQEIIALSDADTWEQAKLEWVLDGVYKEDESDTCLCGHFPIIEICELRNRFNNHTAIVGNCCVKKFLGLPSDKIFQAVSRVERDREKSLNAETIKHAYRQGWINEWEIKFYIDIIRKRNLSDKQLEKKIQINNRVLRQIINRRNRRNS